MRVFDVVDEMQNVQVHLASYRCQPGPSFCHLDRQTPSPYAIVSAIDK